MSRTIGWGERRWAKHAYQRFLGLYEEFDGLWFASATPEQEVQQILGGFAWLPEELQLVAREYRLTISVATDTFTLGRHSSSVYGDWRAAVPELVSAHLELGHKSLAEEVTFRAHLVHEVGHLLFWSLPPTARREFAEHLQRRTVDDTVEVTPYVQDALNEHRLGLGKCATHRPFDNCLWLQEAFPDSLAVHFVPDYSGRNENTTVNIAERIDAIRDVTGLELRSI